MAAQLNLSWYSVDQIMRRVVKRGLKRRATQAMAHLGIDEKSFRFGHQNVITLNDLDGGRVLDIIETHTTKATEKQLPEQCCERGAEQEDPDDKGLGSRVPQLRKLSDLNPVLLWEARHGTLTMQ